MTEQEFLEAVQEVCDTYYLPKEEVEKKRKSWWHRERLTERRGKFLKDITLDDCIMTKWCSGGVGGGSCWSTDDHYAISGEKEPEFHDLDRILDRVVPNITYLQYKKLLYSVKPDLIEYDEWTESEYYGNSTQYTSKKVVLRRLWERLQGLGVIEN
jgi:hypothetical protein